jgi:hypothetical protein
MDTKDPYLLLIENSLKRLTLKYKSEFRYEVHKVNLGFTFTIYQSNTPIFFKEVPVLETEQVINSLYYQVVIDFFSGGIERILMQRENEKRLFRKTHADIKEEGNIQTTKGHW